VTVAAAHHSICRHLYDSLHAAQKSQKTSSNLSRLQESNMSTLWRREEFLRICSKDELAEKAQDIEATIPVKKSQETQYNFNLKSFFENRFRGRQPDRVAINEALQIVYISEFNWSTDRDEGFREVKETEANKQHKSIIGALKAAAPKWEFEQINFVVGYSGPVLRATSTPSSKNLMYRKEKKTSSSPIT